MLSALIFALKATEKITGLHEHGMKSPTICRVLDFKQANAAAEDLQKSNSSAFLWKAFRGT